ncbi:MAG: sugar transferase [Thiothrix sp.]|nr:sugar transferase [Thiothrix sp.]HPQ96846.1 sugar transferase [Thiolinea sp.]
MILPILTPATRKRLLDVVAATLGLLLLSPVLLLLSLLCLLSQGWPVFFIQERTGLQGRLFRLVKFRTMCQALDRQGRPLPDARRLTAIGRFLRASSLDELPELWNILRGDMSLVGPRPLLPEYLPLYSSEQARRHEILPGLTGWAQINGRNALSWEEKFRLDVWYVDHHSLALDMRILWATIHAVLRREGISAADHVSMHPFTGGRP